MPYLFAHSEQNVKGLVRNLRRDFIPASSYKHSMKLHVTKLRKERGLTVQGLADKAGMSKSYLSEIANGKKQVNARILDSLARALGCNPIDIIDDDSVEPDLIEHIRMMQRLNPEDRQAVIRHAVGLLGPDGDRD